MLYYGLSLIYVRGQLFIQCSISVRTVVSSTTAIKCSSSVFRNPFSQTVLVAPTNLLPGGSLDYELPCGPTKEQFL